MRYETKEKTVSNSNIQTIASTVTGKSFTTQKIEIHDNLQRIKQWKK